jgi:putative transposase
MPRLSPIPVVLTERERTQLQALVRQHKTPQQLAVRASIILEADAGRNVNGYGSFGTTLSYGKTAA